jgi:hypothetical protein
MEATQQPINYACDSVTGIANLTTPITVVPKATVPTVWAKIVAVKSQKISMAELPKHMKDSDSDSAEVSVFFAHVKMCCYHQTIDRKGVIVIPKEQSIYDEEVVINIRELSKNIKIHNMEDGVFYSGNFGKYDVYVCHRSYEVDLRNHVSATVLNTNREIGEMYRKCGTAITNFRKSFGVTLSTPYKNKVASYMNRSVDRSVIIPRTNC